MLQTFLRELKIRRNALIVFGLVIVGFIAMYTAIYPSIQPHATKLINAFGNIYKDIGIENKVSFANLTDYASLEIFGFSWPILAAVLLIGQSGAAISNEIEKGTLGMLLAMPIKRSCIYLGKLLAGLVAVIGLAVLTVGTIVVVARAMNIGFNIHGFITVAFLCCLYALALFCIGLMASSIMNEKSHLYGLMGGLVIVMYLADTLSGLKPSLVNLKYISFFHYFNAQAALANHHIAVASILAFLGSAVISSIIGLMIFTKRDFII